MSPTQNSIQSTWTGWFTAFIRSYAGVSTPWLNNFAQIRSIRPATDIEGDPAGR